MTLTFSNLQCNDFKGTNLHSYSNDISLLPYLYSNSFLFLIQSYVDLVNEGTYHIFQPV